MIWINVIWFFAASPTNLSVSLNATYDGVILFPLNEYVVPTLINLLEADKSLFLLTNSGLDYTNEIMDYVVTTSSNNDFKSWRNIWDVIVVDSNKPHFFSTSDMFYKFDIYLLLF